MSFSRGLNVFSATVSGDIVEASTAIAKINEVLYSRELPDTKNAAIIVFEDTLNPLLGVLKLNKEIFPSIQSDCLAVKNLAESLGFTLSLNAEFYPADVAEVTSKLLIGKKLYPRTEMVPVQITGEGQQPTIQDSIAAADIANEQAAAAATPDSQATIEAQTELSAAGAADIIANSAFQAALVAVDPDFQKLDEEAAESATDYKDNQPLSTIGEEQARLIPQGLVDIINANVGESGDLQSNLSELCQNPLANLIIDVRDRIQFYTNANFGNLNSTLATISGDGALTSQYTALKEAMGGGDGVGGTVALLNEFKDHTDRLSGLVLEKTNENSSNTSQSTTDNFVYNELPTNLGTTIISFSAKEFRSAKYFIQGSAGIEHQMSEYSIIHDSNTVFGREIDTTYTIDPFIKFSASIANGSISLTANSSLPNTSLVIYGIRLMIAKPATSYTNISQYKIIENHQILNAHENTQTDYISQQTSSLGQESTLAGLSEFIQEMFTDMQTGSTAEKQQKLTTAATTINTFGATLRSAMTADYDAYADLTKRAEAMKLAYNWSKGYEDENVKPLLDKTLKSSVIEQLQ